MSKFTMKTKLTIIGCAVLTVVMLSLAAYVTFFRPTAEGKTEVVVNEEQQTMTLTADQKDSISNYGANEVSFVAQLENGIWTNDSETEFIEFTDTTATLTKGKDKTETYSYAIQAVDQRKSDGTDQKQVLTASLNTNEGVYLLTMTMPDKQQDKPAIKCDLFGNSTYKGTQLGRNIQVNGLENEFLALLPDGGNKLVQAVQEAGAQEFPTADAAEWTSKCTIDYEGGTVETAFKYNNKSNASETFVINLSDGTTTWD